MLILESPFQLLLNAALGHSPALPQHLARLYHSLTGFRVHHQFALGALPKSVAR